MSRRKVLLLILLLLIAGFITYTWITFLVADLRPAWQHFLTLSLFVPLIVLFTKNFRKCLLATVLYLIIGTCNLLSLTPSIVWNSYGVRVISIEIETPPFDLLFFGLLLLLCILNFDTFVDIYLDFKETCKPRVNENILVDDEGVTITGETCKTRIRWDDITQMNVYKKDFLTWDRVELEIAYSSKSLIINEDVEGWDSFVVHTKKLFVTIPKDWHIEIIHPPFATNFRIIYKKI